MKLEGPKASFRHRVSAVLALSIILCAGLLIRLWVSPAEGYGFDVGTNKGWSFSSVGVGPGRSYGVQLKGSMMPNYPPLSLLIFHITGWTYMKTLSPTLDIDQPIYQSIIKLPAMLADLATAILLCVFIAKWKRNRWWGVLAAAIYVLHPAPIHNSAFWGQTDALYALFLVATFGAFGYGFSFLAGFCMALALLTKLQAVACFPLFAILALKNGWRHAILSFTGACLATAIVIFPFWWQGFIADAINIYFTSVGFYSSVSSAAYNIWWSLYADAAGNMNDADILFHIASFRTIGYVLFCTSLLFPIVVLWRRLKPSPATGATLPAIFFAASFSSYAFFLWNTQMHERYGFAFVPLALIVALVSWKGARLYALISGLIYWNLLGWLALGWFDKALYAEFPVLDVFIASALTIFFFSYAMFAFEIKRSIPLPNLQPWITRDIFKKWKRVRKRKTTKNVAKKHR